MDALGTVWILSALESCFWRWGADMGIFARRARVKGKRVGRQVVKESRE
jgi:hypothetical protein